MFLKGNEEVESCRIYLAVVQARDGKLINGLLSSLLMSCGVHGNASPQNHPSVMSLAVFVHSRVGSSVDSAWKGKVILHEPGDWDILRLAHFPTIG